MTRKSKSETSSKPSLKRAKKSTVAEDLIQGLKEIAAHRRGEIKLRTRQIVIHDDVDVKAVRERSGLSQSQFADRFGFNSRTLQEWEQGRSQPENALRAYLKVIDRNATAVEQALFQR
jgi:putative transcriptional regulator